MKTQHSLANLYRGKVNNRNGFDTAIDKQPINSSIYLSLQGLAGDECADKRHHGGPDRALHQYPLEHYDYWLEKYGNKSEWLAPGMGENISVHGMTENTVCIGDTYFWGDAIIEVSQPRSPCFKLNRQWGIDTMSIDMQESGRCGWLYRVIQPGLVSVNDSLILSDRILNAMTVREVCEMFFGDPLNRDKLLKLKQQAKLSVSWQEKVIQRLESNTVENWQFRLFGLPKTI
jgi:MOSC domain-containing protein YiiM